MKHPKVRLTITLPSDLLSLVDGLVDTKTIRNRSHAVEHVLRESLSRNVRTAVLLVGGSNSAAVPALKLVHNRPLIHHVLQHLTEHGFSKLVICAGKNTETLKKALEQDSAWGLELIFVSGESTPLGTGGALKLATPYLESSPFLVLHGDVLTTLNLTDFSEFHLQQGTLATIAVKPRMSEKKFGQVFLQGNKIVRFLSAGRTEGISIVNTGLYILHPSVLSLIPEALHSDLESELFQILAEKRELSAFIFQGLWHDISSTTSYNEALAQLKNELQ